MTWIFNSDGQRKGRFIEQQIIYVEILETIRGRIQHWYLALPFISYIVFSRNVPKRESMKVSLQMMLTFLRKKEENLNLKTEIMK